MLLNHSMIRNRTLTGLFLLFLTCQRQPDVISEKALPVYGGILRQTLSTAIETLDPQHILFYRDRQLASLVYEGLTTLAMDGMSVVPALAESWTVDSTMTRWEFTLRDEVYFHDDPCFPGGRGRKLVPEDVVHTFQRIADPERPSIYAYLFLNRIQGFREYNQGENRTLSGIEVVDEHRVAFTLIQPAAVFLKLLATAVAYIVPREAVDRYGAGLANHCVGTGPFRLLRWRPLREMTFGRHERYWRTDSRGRRQPYLDAVTVNLEGNPDIAMVNFMKGDCDILELPAAAFPTFSSDTTLAMKWKVVGRMPEMHVRFLGFSLDNGSPLARKITLRRAVAAGFDREKLLSLIHI